MKKMFAIVVCFLAALPLAGCFEEKAPSAASRNAAQIEILANEAAVTVGMPAVKNFAEKRQLKAIYELRDTANLVTYSYTIDMNGKRHKICPTSSVGFGVPYATQYSAPKSHQRWYVPKTADYVASWGVNEADQPEPNGLYMPQQADGTWILCLHPVTKELAPTYVEPRVIVYLFEMSSVD